MSLPIDSSNPVEPGKLYLSANESSAKILGIAIEQQLRAMERFPELTRTELQCFSVWISSRYYPAEFDLFRRALGTEDLLTRDWRITMMAKPIVTLNNLEESMTRFHSFCAELFSLERPHIGDVRCSLDYNSDGEPECSVIFAVDPNERDDQEQRFEGVVRELMGEDVEFEYLV